MYNEVIEDKEKVSAQRDFWHIYTKPEKLKCLTLSILNSLYIHSLTPLNIYFYGMPSCPEAVAHTSMIFKCACKFIAYLSLETPEIRTTICLRKRIYIEIYNSVFISF